MSSLNLNLAQLKKEKKKVELRLELFKAWLCFLKEEEEYNNPFPTILLI